MSKLIPFVLLLLLSCSTDRVSRTPPNSPASTSSASPAAEEEEFGFVIHRDERGIEVTLRFRGNSLGRTPLSLPDAWGGEERLFDDLRGLSLVTEGATLMDGPSPATKVVSHVPLAMLELVYRFPVTPDPREIADGQTYRAQVHPSWFHFIGHALFVAPDGDDSEPRKIRIRWEGMETGVRLANSFGIETRDQHIRTTIGKLRHAVYVGGDFRVQTASVRGKPVNVALRGTWGFTDEAFVDLVEKIVTAERDFFGDHSFDRFLVTLIPTGKGCCSYGGTGLTDSFATFIDSDLPIEGRMKHLLAHELFHTWNGRKIGRQDPEELVYWFSEGFTDYYADALLLRASLMTFDEAVESYNRVLRAYYLSPARNSPNAEIARSFWKDRAVERLPYQRGNILAHEWNARIKTARSNEASIDDVMRALLRDALAVGDVVSAAKIDALVAKHLPGGIRDDLARYVDAGETIPVSAESMGPCAKLTLEKLGPFDLGFDERASDEAGVLQGVRRDGPAYRAGARDGMKVVRSRYGNDPVKPVELTVASGSALRSIVYLPQGPVEPVPQFSVVAARVAELGARCFE